MQIKDLKANAKNPRKMSADQLQNLAASMKKFGDLSGFLYNRRTKNMFGGHQKSKVIPKNCPIKIEHKFDAPTSCKTVAEGYVLIDGERYKYREVDADPEWEMEAMIAANKHSGEWDEAILKLAAADFKDLDWKIAGFQPTELKSMGILKTVVPESLLKSPVLPTEEEVDDLNGDDGQEEPTDDETDEEYVKNTVQTEERIPTEQIPSMVHEKNPFDKIEEKTEVPGRRIVIIIDCPNEDVKKELREKLRPQVEGVGAKFF